MNSNPKRKIKNIILEYLNEKISGGKYYRAIIKFEGNTVVFEPKGYYERFDDDGNPVLHTGGLWWRSDVPETSASKLIGGAVLGLWSMGNHKGLNLKEAFIYEISESPDLDLSGVTIDDFEWLKEVRYRRAVEGRYVGKFIYTPEYNKSANNFYERINQDPWDEDTNIDVEDWEDFENKIFTMGVGDLK